jgi:hypothetical protein
MYDPLYEVFDLSGRWTMPHIASPTRTSRRWQPPGGSQTSTARAAPRVYGLPCTGVGRAVLGCEAQGYPLAILRDLEAHMVMPPEVGQPPPRLPLPVPHGLRRIEPLGLGAPQNSLLSRAGRRAERAAHPEADRRIALLAPLEIVLRLRRDTQAAAVPQG